MAIVIPTNSARSAQPPRHLEMHDLGGHRRPLDLERGTAALDRWSMKRPPLSCPQEPSLPADQRQPCRLRQAGEPERARHAAGGDRQDQRDAGPALLHHSHRRHQPSVEGQGVRRRRPGHQDDQQEDLLCPGEHDMLDDENGKAYLQRYGKETKGAGWYSFDQHGIHFIGLVNVVISRPAASAISETTSSNGWSRMSRCSRRARPCGLRSHPLWTVYPNGGGGPRTVRKPSPTSRGSGR